MKNKKLWIIIAIVILAVIALVWTFMPRQNTSTDTRPVIKIGATLPITGNMADVGISGKQALMMAFDKWKNQNTKYQYDLIIEDDSLDPKKVALIVNKFINMDHVSAVLSMFSIGANVTSPITNHAKIIHVTCSYGSQPAEGFYNFNNHTQYDENARALISELKKKNIKTISLFTQNNIGSLQQAEVLTDMFKKDGIKVLANETFNPDVRDFTMIINKALRHGKPDMFFISSLSPNTLIFAKNLKEVTGEMKLTSINDFTKYVDKTPFNNLWFVESAYGTEDFIKIFAKQYKNEPLSCTSNMYDNLDMLIWAFENTAPRDGDIIPNNDDVVKTLHSIKNWHGAIGEISVDESGIVQSKASIKIIKNGHVEIIKE